jgi:membrane-associated phospholipid phosphatase
MMETLLEKTALTLSAHLERRREISPLLWWCGALAIVGAFALPIDLSVAAFCRNGDLPGDIARVLHLSEVFAHGAGIALIMLSAAVLDPANRRRLPRVAIGAYLAGLLANGGKLLIARTRPDAFSGGDILDSFGAWFPFLPGRITEGWNYAEQGFPSAHAATAVGFALGLMAVYPRGRWLFVLFATLASLQRISAGAHYPSDVFIGAAIGCFVVAFLNQGTRAAEWLDAWEQGPQSTCQDG